VSVEKPCISALQCREPAKKLSETSWQSPPPNLRQDCLANDGHPHWDFCLLFYTSVCQSGNPASPFDHLLNPSRRSSKQQALTFKTVCTAFFSRVSFPGVSLLSHCNSLPTILFIWLLSTGLCLPGTFVGPFERILFAIQHESMFQTFWSWVCLSLGSASSPNV